MNSKAEKMLSKKHTFKKGEIKLTAKPIFHIGKFWSDSSEELKSVLFMASICSLSFEYY
ncbi:MAG: hypothetical protein AB8B69_12310 [Chitinophagales bacterium]